VTTEQRRRLLGFACLALACFAVLSIVPVTGTGAFARAFPDGSIMGVMGRGLADGGFAALGAGFLFVPILLALGGAVCFRWIDETAGMRWGALCTGLLVLVPAFASLWAPGAGIEVSPLLPAASAGWIGHTLGLPLVALLGGFGAALVILVFAAALSIATIGWNPAGSLATGGRQSFQWMRSAAAKVREKRVPAEPESAPEPAAVSAPAFAGAEPVAAADVSEPPAPAEEKPAGILRGRLGRKRGNGKAAPVPDLAEFGDPGSADRPPLDLLSLPPEKDASISESELDRLGEVLIRTLGTFKVEGQIGGRTTGPVVTQFEVVPAPGVKVNRIASLDADLALALKAPSIRIVAPIPGKGAVGVEVPNPEAEIVYLRKILESAAFLRSRGQLPLALGKDLTGRPNVADLVRMPHLLIAGATGSGKSICINTLITSLVYRHSPQSL
jgi:S-DNA-T family DNA segregation ATPase FtsK/SpoIIIE